MSKQILVGFTGGLRSAVLVALLREQGHSVLPVFIDFSDFLHPVWRTVNAALGRADAAHIALERAKLLGVDLKILPAGGLFEQKVVDPTLHAALSKRAEEPAVLLHSKLLLPVLDQLARDSACDAWATGHRVNEQGGELHWDGSPENQLPLVAFAGLEILRNGMFPLGAFQPAQLEKLGSQLGIPVEERPSDFSPARHPASLDPVGWQAWAGPRLTPELTQRGWVKHPKVPVALGDHTGIFHYPVGTPVPNLSIPEDDLAEVFPEGIPDEKERMLWVVDYDSSAQIATVMTRLESRRNSVLLDEIHWWETHVPADGIEIEAVTLRIGTAFPVCTGRVQFHLNSTGRLDLKKGCGLLFAGTKLVFLKDQRAVGIARVAMVPAAGAKA